MKYPLITIEHEIEEKRSRFIAELMPCNDEHPVKQRIQQLKNLHPKASHVCSGFRLINSNNQINEGFSDDGEPSGTAGMPILKVLRHHDLINCAVLITRYFGGTKLGTGGLQRAYSQSCSDAIQQLKNEQLKTLVPQACVDVSVDFPQENVVRHLAQQHQAQVEEVTYQHNGIVMQLILDKSRSNELALALQQRNILFRIK
ncbi:IMPACT family protein [Bacterioplanoides sp.]|uniref:IMPACT family protein n=1 Tax=Bacterioplanoides sp. TaxID=2066072 RepID=UPI003AFFEB44